MRPLLVILVVTACREKPHIPANAETRPPLPPIEQDDCLTYRDTVELRGVLRREVHPGRPNYESIAAGDEEDVGFYLHLNETVCTWPVGTPPEPGEEPVDRVRRVQLVPGSVGYGQLRPQLDREIVVRGTLFSAYTGHHHAPLLLQVQRSGK